jgi:DnaJ-class molecular chaperone
VLCKPHNVIGFTFLIVLSFPCFSCRFFFFSFQALLGFTRNLTHLDGHVVQLVRENGVTQPGYVQTIKGEGMPLFERPTSYGDLFVEYNVVIPTHLSKETRRGASKLGSPSPGATLMFFPLHTALAEAFYGKSHHDRDKNDL